MIYFAARLCRRRHAADYYAFDVAMIWRYAATRQQAYAARYYALKSAPCRASVYAAHAAQRYAH